MKIKPFRLADLAEVARGSVVGDPDVTIDGFASVGEASPGDIVYVEKRRSLKQALAGDAACIIVTEPPEDSERTCLVVENPRLAFTRIVRHMAPPRLPDPGIHPSAVVVDDAVVDPGAYVGPFVVVDAEARVGRGSRIFPGSYIGRGCTVGADCIIGPHAVLYPGVHVGDRVLIQAGTVLGSDGFGYVMDERKEYLKIPQLGTVVIEDDVEFGSNTSVDRATLGETRIGKDSKIDNLIQIAHNVIIGSHTAVSGQTGIAGSSSIGNYCVLAGQVGVGDHVTIEDQVIIGAQAGVPTGKRVRGKQVLWGSPAKPVDEWKRMIAVLSRLARRKKADD